MIKSVNLFNNKYNTYIVFLSYFFVLIGIILINPGSFLNFLYYFFFWFVIFYYINKRALDEFIFCYAVNSVLIIFFYFIQIYYYPDSFGTTSPLGSWTDDSYFFALVADSIPPELQVRDHFSEYTHPFTTIIKFISFLSITHPMDVIFFQSGVSALLASSSKRFMFQISGDKKMSDFLFFIIIFCPFLAMHGGVVLLRDTFVSALLMFSLCCINDRKYILAVSAIIISLFVRPGTILILLFLYAIIYSSEIKKFLISFKVKALAGILAPLICLFFFTLSSNEIFFEFVILQIKASDISFIGREMYEDIYNKNNSIFVSIQESNFIIKLIAGGLYFFSYPFFSYAEFFAFENFDLRTFLTSIIMPIYAIGLNAFFIAAILTKSSELKKINMLILAVLVVYILLGTYSLQTRHKIIVQSVFYTIVVFGLFKSKHHSKLIGFFISISIFALQLTVAINE
jgi:hypothetical protein